MLYIIVKLMIQSINQSISAQRNELLSRSVNRYAMECILASLLIHTFIRQVRH